MSDDKAAAAPSAPGPSKAPLLLALVNTLAVLAAAGTLYYTKMVYKKPRITEEGERKRLEAAHVQKTVVEATAPGVVGFGPVTVNIEPFPAPKPPAEGEETESPQPGHGAIKGKLHYVTMAFSVEIVDGGQQAAVLQVMPKLMDQLLATLAHRPFHELTTVQGRYVLRTQIMDMVNRLTQDLPSHPPLLASAVTKPDKDKKDAGHGAPAAGGEHGAPAEGGHGAPAAKEGKDGKGEEHHGPPIRELYRDGLVSNVYFTQFIVQ